jgi:hypothetical protein
MAQDHAVNTIAQQIGQITKSLEGTVAQIEALNRKIEEANKTFMENMTAMNENMRLIIEVVKKQRTNTKESLDELKKHIDEEIEKLYNKKSLEGIMEDQVEAVKKLKNINAAVGENLYLAQLLSIIQSLREITGRALTVKSIKEKK